jgi:hypothetical protein
MGSSAHAFVNQFKLSIYFCSLLVGSTSSCDIWRTSDISRRESCHGLSRTLRPDHRIPNWRSDMVGWVLVFDAISLQFLMIVDPITLRYSRLNKPVRLSVVPRPGSDEIYTHRRVVSQARHVLRYDGFPLLQTSSSCHTRTAR